MSRILVEISVPAADARGDVFIPFECRIFEITELVKSALIDKVAGRFIAQTDTVLCESETGAVLDRNRTPQELGLANGTRLMLI